MDAAGSSPYGFGNHARQVDFEFWTSQKAKDLVKEEEITQMNQVNPKRLLNLS